jgi:hypothetical protein
VPGLFVEELQVQWLAARLGPFFILFSAQSLRDILLDFTRSPRTDEYLLDSAWFEEGS